MKIDKKTLLTDVGAGSDYILKEMAQNGIDLTGMILCYDTKDFLHLHKIEDIKKAIVSTFRSNHEYSSGSLPDAFMAHHTLFHIESKNEDCEMAESFDEEFEGFFLDVCLKLNFNRQKYFGSFSTFVYDEIINNNDIYADKINELETRNEIFKRFYINEASCEIDEEDSAACKFLYENELSKEQLESLYEELKFFEKEFSNLSSLSSIRTKALIIEQRNVSEEILNDIKNGNLTYSYTVEFYGGYAGDDYNVDIDIEDDLENKLISIKNEANNESIVANEAAGLNDDGSEIVEQSAGMSIN